MTHSLLRHGRFSYLTETLLKSQFVMSLVLFVHIGGTDIVDQRSDKYTVSSMTSRWSRKLFDFILDGTRVNAQTVWSVKRGLDPRKSNSFEFLKNLAESLIVPHMRERYDFNPT